jgi:hypothetical protein
VIMSNASGFSGLHATMMLRRIGDGE